jgi:hypothetical protein
LDGRSGETVPQVADQVEQIVQTILATGDRSSAWKSTANSPTLQIDSAGERSRVSLTVEFLNGPFAPGSSAGGEIMRLWMLSFGERGAAIIEAESLIHARLRAAVKGFVRASSFVGGCQVDPERNHRGGIADPRPTARCREWVFVQPGLQVTPTTDMFFTAVQSAFSRPEIA